MSKRLMPETALTAERRARAVILAIRPELDGGRYPVKRVAGDRVAIEADIVVDGHDAIRAVLLDRAPGASEWRETELAAAPNDVWRGELEVGALGQHAYTVVAWVDAFATWRRGLARKVEAGVDVALDLRDGARLVRVVDPAAAAQLEGAAPTAERIALGLSDPLAATMRRAPRTDAARYRVLAVHVERPLAAAAAWYELFPRSARGDGTHGTLADVEARLDYVAELGFDILYLPPIHPIGHAYRKGPDNAATAGPDDPGSPWAIGADGGGHTAVHPQLGTLADFDRLVAACRARGLELALDIAFQASPDHPWVAAHPTWFRARADGSIQYAENPPKKYQDVYPFDFESEDWRALWAALRDVFLFWAARGVRVFRVDNPHTKPIRFWEWCLGEVQAAYPDAIFLAEAFTRPKLMGALAKSGFSQSYTYFTWRTSKAELTAYATELAEGTAEYLRPCFWPTTPDIFPEHLVHGGRAAFVLRLVLAATLAPSYGIYGPSYELQDATPRPGVEELARNEKYQVRAWDLARPDSLRFAIARINQIRRAEPALRELRNLRFHETDNELVIAYSKGHILIIANLDPHHTHRAWVTLDPAPDAAYQVHDLFGDARYTWRGARNFVELDPERSPVHVFAIREHVRSEHEFEYYL
ncbi:MAG TPA: alpha-1,4-glucan--maltose-1-phosphate maltosyltransferase [Kofleriaceae bacterium]|jgi:starch synthase (maltosyl-transferring)